MGLFGAGLRLIVVEGVEAWKAPDVKAIAAYLKSPAPGTTLALVAGELKKDAPLAKAVAGQGEVLLWDVAQRGLPRWIAEQFKLQRHDRRARGVPRCSPSSSATTSTSSRARSRSSRPGRRATALTAARRRALVAPRAGSPPWNLTDAWGARDVGGVLRATERMLDRTRRPASRRRSRASSAA